jgi:hypothetical protein
MTICHMDICQCVFDFSTFCFVGAGDCKSRRLKASLTRLIGPLIYIIVGPSYWRRGRHLMTRSVWKVIYVRVLLLAQAAIFYSKRMFVNSFRVSTIDYSSYWVGVYWGCVSRVRIGPLLARTNGSALLGVTGIGNGFRTSYSSSNKIVVLLESLHSLVWLKAVNSTCLFRWNVVRRKAFYYCTHCWLTNPRSAARVDHSRELT